MSERFDARRFEELILLVARRCERDSTFGATKLNKLLFFADFAAYRKLGRSLTGADYQKLEHGPAPKQLLPTREALLERGELFPITRDYFGKEQKRLIAGREPDVSGFSGEEIALVDEIIDSLRDLDAAAVTQLSHTFIGWRAVEYGDVIPYETAKVQPELLTEDDRNATRTLKVLNWNKTAGWPRIPMNAPLQ